MADNPDRKSRGSTLNRHYDFFGIIDMPWVIRGYFLLFVILVIVVCLSAAKPEQEKLFTLASDGLKLVLGGLLGTLSMAVKRDAREEDSTDDTA